jgi:hypothetical protein
LFFGGSGLIGPSGLFGLVDEIHFFPLMTGAFSLLFAALEIVCFSYPFLASVVCFAEFETVDALWP